MSNQQNTVFRSVCWSSRCTQREQKYDCYNERVINKSRILIERVERRVHLWKMKKKGGVKRSIVEGNCGTERKRKERRVAECIDSAA